MKKRRHTPEQITRKLREADPLPPATRAWPLRRLERIAEKGDRPLPLALLVLPAGQAPRALRASGAAKVLALAATRATKGLASPIRARG